MPCAEGAAALPLYVRACEPVTVTLPIPVAAPEQPCVLPSKITPLGQVTVTVGVALAMVNDCGTFVAALKLLSPDCEAVMVQLPAPVMWTVEPVAVQLPLAPKPTALPEDAVALTAKSALPNVLPARAPNVIVWFSLAI